METMLPPWQFSMDLAVLEFQKFRDSLLNVRFLVHFFGIFSDASHTRNPETLVFQRSGVFYSRASGGVELYGHRIVGSCETDKALFCLGSWQVQSRSLEGDFRMIVTVLSPRISGWMSV